MSRMSVGREAIPLSLPTHVYMWDDSTDNGWVTVDILLPSGCRTEDIDLKVRDNGWTLFVKLIYPNIFLSATSLEDSTGGIVTPDHAMARGLASNANFLKAEFDHGPVKGLCTVRLPVECDLLPVGVPGVCGAMDFVFF